MDLGLKEKVAIVTGASRGIGRAIARRLVEEGARVVVCARGVEGLNEATAELSRFGTVHPVALDFTAPGAAARLAAEAVDTFGRIDVFVGNAGSNLRKPFDETTLLDAVGSLMGRDRVVH